VLWVRGDHAYASLPDSTVAEAGDRVTFRDRKRNLATGDVTGVIRGEVAVIQITSGSLADIRKLERVRLEFARAAMPPLSALRIGLPSGGRALPCDGLLPAPAAAPYYRVSPLGPLMLRLVRTPADSAHSESGAPTAWPETLFVSLFDESADEEISLERGELDVAVFRPGEISAHLRGDPRWRESSIPPLRRTDAPPDSVRSEPAAVPSRSPGPVVVGAAHRRRVIAMGSGALAGLIACRSEKTPR
jgi:hypothetical protein